MNKLAIALFALLFPLALCAYKPYHAKVHVDSASASVSATNLVDLSRDLKSSEIKKLIPFYNPTSATAINFNFRGILASTAFPQNSTILYVTFPQTGTVTTFKGETREESLLLFKDYIRDGGRKHNLLPAYALYSPIDPIAGNPNSLLSQMGYDDYLLGRLSPLAGCDCEWSAQPIVHQFQSGISYGRAFSHKFDTTSVTMPLRYSYSPNLTWAFIIDAPLTFNSNGGAYSLFGSIGTGLRVPITSAWSLMGISRFGSGGSLDLCTAACMWLNGFTSNYDWKIYDWIFSITNYAGYVTSVNFWLSGVNFNYHLHNYIFNNGISWTSCEGYSILGRPVHARVYFMDNEIARGHLYMHRYDEFGISFFATGINPCIDYDCVSLGFKYQFGAKSYKGYFADIVYQF